MADSPERSAATSPSPVWKSGGVAGLLEKGTSFVQRRIPSFWTGTSGGSRAVLVFASNTVTLLYYYF